MTLLTPAERVDEGPGILQRIRRGETIDHYETVRRRKDGSLLDISLTVSPLRDGTGRVVGASKIARDITGRKQAEAALRKSEADLARRVEELKQADLSKNQFMAMLAHELRNPLAPLGNALDVVRQAGGEPRAIAPLLPMMERQVRAMSRIIDDLLDVSRVTRGKVRLQREAVELSAIVERCAEMTRHQSDARGQTLAVSLPQAPVHLSADPLRLEQVFCNLLDNASKYGAQGGHVWLSAELAGATRAGAGREVVVRVRDDGSGIAPDLLPRVFEVFTQGERSLDRPQGGLGIGLALVRNLVELHGGRVQAESPAPGFDKGSEFRVVLPLAEAAAAAVAAAETELQGNGADRAASVQRRVLVVDDNRDAAQALAMLLSEAGHEVRTAHDGLEALELAAEFVPEAVVLDIGLPGIDGYEAARRLRQRPELAGARLIGVSGYGRDADRTLAEEAGFDHFLVKPVQAEALKRLLASA